MVCSLLAARECCRSTRSKMETVCTEFWRADHEMQDAGGMECANMCKYAYNGSKQTMNGCKKTCATSSPEARASAARYGQWATFERGSDLAGVLPATARPPCSFFCLCRVSLGELAARKSPSLFLWRPEVDLVGRRQRPLGRSIGSPVRIRNHSLRLLAKSTRRAQKSNEDTRAPARCKKLSRMPVVSICFYWSLSRTGRLIVHHCNWLAAYYVVNCEDKRPLVLR